MPAVDGDRLFSKGLGDIRDKRRLLACLARCSIWAQTSVVAYVDRENHRRYRRRGILKANGGLWFPNTARRRPATPGARPQFNEKAQRAIWTAVGVKFKYGTVSACHIWEKTATRPNCYTALANLVLLPRAIAGLSDHWPLAWAFLRWKSYKAFKWSPSGRAPGPSKVPRISFRSINNENPPKSDSLWTKSIERKVRKSVEKRRLKRLGAVL
jgi:hypothetical protein